MGSGYFKGGVYNHFLGNSLFGHKLRKEEMEKLLDLYAKANGQASADIIDYIMDNDDTRTQLIIPVKIVNAKSLRLKTQRKTEAIKRIAVTNRAFLP